MNILSQLITNPTPGNSNLVDGCTMLYPNHFHSKADADEMFSLAAGS